MPPSSKTSEFERGSRRSSSDYDKFSSKEQWSKWQRSLIGTAAEHKVIKVLDPSCTPDPNDKDAVSLFKRQQEFMYSVFTKVLQEGKAVDILRNYSDPQKANFGDAQAIYSDLRDHFEAGAIARVSAAALDTQLTNLRLNKHWTKTVHAFMNKLAHLVKDHKEATHDVHDDAYYIEKVNTTLSEHKEMAAFIQQQKNNEAQIQRRMVGNVLLPLTFDSHMFELTEYATVLDSQNAQAAMHRRAHESRTGRGGRGGGGRGRFGGRGRGTGRGGGRGRGGQRENVHEFIPGKEWDKLPWSEREKVFEQ